MTTPRLAAALRHCFITPPLPLLKSSFKTACLPIVPGMTMMCPA